MQVKLVSMVSWIFEQDNDVRRRGVMWIVYLGDAQPHLGSQLRIFWHALGTVEQAEIMACSRRDNAQERHFLLFVKVKQKVDNRTPTRLQALQDLRS